MRSHEAQLTIITLSVSPPLCHAASCSADLSVSAPVVINNILRGEKVKVKKYEIFPYLDLDLTRAYFSEFLT